MDFDKGLRSERTSFTNNGLLFNSVGGHLAKIIGPDDHNFTEMNLSKRNFDITQSGTRMKVEFFPFLNERDHLNRLLTIPSKYDPSKLAEPSNPILYYKAERFNKIRLRLDQAERNKHSLQQLLKYKQQNQNSNILELDKAIRLKKLSKGRTGFLKTARWLGFGEEFQEDQSGYDSSDKLGMNFEILETEGQLSLSIGKSNPITPCLLKNLNEIRTSRKQNVLNLQKVNSSSTQNQRVVKSKSEIPLKNIFNRKEDFSNYYKKLDNDIREMSTSSKHWRQKTWDNICNLNQIVNKLKGKKHDLQIKIETGYSIASPSSSGLFSTDRRKHLPNIHLSQEKITGNRSQSDDKTKLSKNLKADKEMRRRKLTNN